MNNFFLFLFTCPAGMLSNRGQKESGVKRAAPEKAKRKRNNWRGPFGEAAVYAVVFWAGLCCERAALP
ncbi:MAG: hypothetical protein BGO52_08435 [Sphingobacteriales bacterium 44-61]|nr:MAG: hypothetical protein BGO52_08435 [Sphingobacteriales bacterium 44-61]